MNAPHNTAHPSWFRAWDRLPLALIALVVTYGIGNEAFGGTRYTRSYVTRARTCQANLKRIVDAKQQYTREVRLRSGERLPDGALWENGAFLQRRLNVRPAETTPLGQSACSLPAA